MNKSIGGKVFTFLTVLGIVFILAIVLNIAALGTIDKNNSEMTEIYLELSNKKGELSTAFQQVQLYENLSYFKKDSSESEQMIQKLEVAVTDTKEYMDLIGKLTEKTQKKQLIEKYDSWNAVMTEFIGFSEGILEAVSNEDYSEAEKMINAVQGYKTPVQEAQEEYEKTYDEVVESVSSHKKSAERICLISFLWGFM